MKPIHVGRRNVYGKRTLYTKTSRRIFVGGKNRLGELTEDWCKDDGGKMVVGWYWTMLDGESGLTFPCMRDAVADFERERAERRARSGHRWIKLIGQVDRECADAAERTRKEHDDGKA